MLDKETILGLLHSIDDGLQFEQSIVICGSASLILQGYDFRRTFDVDFTTLPSPAVLSALGKLGSGRSLFDLQALGVIQLLDDYENRLVPIEDNFKHLKVYVLSKLDWFVSKLDTPKLSDTVNYNVLSVSDVNDALSQMHKYTGLSTDKALFDLNLVKTYLSEGKQME